MANSTSNIDLIAQAQASKEVTANGALDAASQAMTYGRRQSTCSGRTFGYYGGNVTLSGGTMSQIANGTLTLTASATNYIVANKATGAVSFSTATTNWNDSANYWRLYSVVVGAATVTSYTDSRELAKYTGGGGGGGGGGGTWGGITGTLSDQTDLQNALNAKAASSHNHLAGDLSGVVKTVNGSAPDGSGNVSGVVNSINGTGPDASGNVTIAGGGDASTNTATSVDGEVALFSGTAGKTLKRATGSGLAKLTSGVLGTATAGTDYASPPSGTSILYGDGAGGFSNVTIGANLTFVAGTLAATGGGGGGTWGGITGTLSDQTDLQNALDAKANSSAVPAQFNPIPGTNITLSGTYPNITISSAAAATGGDASTNTATSVDGEVALFSGTDGKTLKRATGSGLAKLTSGVLGTATAGTDYSTPAGAETQTNKRVTARVGSTTSSATPTINTDLYDIYKLTAQAADITSFSTNLTGTPVDGDILIIEITGTAARAITWGASFEASTIALPTTTVSTAMLAVALMWNAATSKWRCMGVA